MSIKDIRYKIDHFPSTTPVSECWGEDLNPGLFWLQRLCSFELVKARKYRTHTARNTLLKSL